MSYRLLTPFQFQAIDHRDTLSFIIAYFLGIIQMFAQRPYPQFFAIHFNRHRTALHQLVAGELLMTS